MNERRHCSTIAQLSGARRHARAYRRQFPPPLHRRPRLGFTLAEVEAATAVFLGEPSDRILNPLGIVHGGWALTLIDSCCGCAAHTTLPPASATPRVETKVNFVRAITPETGQVRAEGRVLARGRTIITAEGKLTDCARQALGARHVHAYGACVRRREIAMSEDDIVIVGMARTPMGGLLGELANLSAPDLGAVAVKAAMKEADAKSADTIFMGNVLERRPRPSARAPSRAEGRPRQSHASGDAEQDVRLGPASRRHGAPSACSPAKPTSSSPAAWKA